MAAKYSEQARAYECEHGDGSCSLVVPPLGAVLCYIEEPFAYFTTLPLEEQWGDDWNNSPMEHNAGSPSIPSDYQMAEGVYWEVYRIAYEAPHLRLSYDQSPDLLPALSDPRRIDSGIAPGCGRHGIEHHYFTPDPRHFSVREVNSGLVPWLSSRSPLGAANTEVWAGATFKEFAAKVSGSRGEVLVPLGTNKPYSQML